MAMGTSPSQSSQLLSKPRNCALPVFDCLFACLKEVLWLGVVALRMTACSAKVQGNLHATLQLFSAIDTKGLGVVAKDDFVDALEGCGDANFLTWMTAAIKQSGESPSTAPAAATSREGFDILPFPLFV
jgi:hypothetical protein